jgi:hypothetical protein
VERKGGRIRRVKRRSDSEIMIDVFEEAERRSHSDQPFELRQYGSEELPIVIDLIESRMVRGDVADIEGGYAVALGSITLQGRQLRDELLAKRKARTFRSRLVKFVLIAFGWLVGVVTPLIIEYLKAKMLSAH